MIQKITLATPRNINRKNNPKYSTAPKTTPAFGNCCSVSEKTLQEVLKFISEKISAPKFNSIIESFANPKEGYIDLERFMLKALKAGKEQIIIAIKYTHPKQDGYLEIAKGSISNIKKQLGNPDFPNKVIGKLEEISDKILLGEEPSVVDIY